MRQKTISIAENSDNFMQQCIEFLSKKKLPHRVTTSNIIREAMANEVMRQGGIFEFDGKGGIGGIVEGVANAPR